MDIWSKDEAQFTQQDIDDYAEIRISKGLPQVTRVKYQRETENENNPDFNGNRSRADDSDAVSVGSVCD